jgi:putative phage-type endonuclease
MTTFTTSDREEAYKKILEKAPYQPGYEDAVVQGTNDWHKLRLGKVTASRVADVLSKGKTGESASRKNYRIELVAQRLTGQPAESFTNAAMEWGTATEPLARIAYELHTGSDVRQVAFIDHPTIEWFGCSPDGLIGDDGLLEIKSPNTTTHLDWMDDGKAPTKHIPQMMAQMACTGAQWADFCSYDPRLPEDLQLFIVRVERDQEYIDNMEKEVKKFLQEVEDTIVKLRGKGVK